ncbi:MAG TPA: radical SAM protein [Terracidiphilus sp.]|nr:radical SAM protein [Terracidiphilus sp.]
MIDNASSGALAQLPILILNTHTLCNCRCVMCDIWQRTEGKQLAVSTLERHRESIRNLGTRQVVLTGGEPLLNTDLQTICEFFREMNIRITVLTTGLLLHKRAALVASLVDEVIVSLDGPPDVHDSVRRIPRAFETIARGVESVRQLRPELPILSRTTLQKKNHRHLRATVNAGRSLGLNSVSFLAADLSSTAFNRDQPWEGERQDEIALDWLELEALEAEIELLIAEHHADIEAGFIVESAGKLRRLANRFREHLTNSAPQAPMCNAPWVSAVLELDGALRPCFFHTPVASTVEATLETALNSPAARAFRAQLDVAANPICQRCVCSLNYRNS